MKTAVHIREETESDIQAISDITLAAFMNVPVSHPTEPFIIHALRAGGALSLSLVAEMKDRVVGHVAFSPVTISDGTTDWFGLGPVSVLPEVQRRGVGIALIKEGLARLRRLGGKGCVLVGDPNYYLRFGFSNIPDLIYEGVPPEVFLALSFCGTFPTGIVQFHEAFLADS